MPIIFKDSSHNLVFGSITIEKVGSSEAAISSMWGENIPVRMMAPPENTIIFDSLENDYYRYGTFNVKLPVKGRYRIEACTAGLVPTYYTMSNNSSHTACPGGLSGCYHTFEAEIGSGDLTINVPAGIAPGDYGSTSYNYGFDKGTVKFYFASITAPVVLTLNNKEIYRLDNCNTPTSSATLRYCSESSFTKGSYTINNSGSAGKCTWTNVPKCIVPPTYMSGTSFYYWYKTISATNDGTVTTTLNLLNSTKKYNLPGTYKYGYDTWTYTTAGLSPITNTTSGPGAGSDGHIYRNGTYISPSTSKCGYCKIIYLGKN